MTAQTQTHDLVLTDTEVRKRFVQWGDGEADREWACLTLLAEHAPGLAPTPFRREADGEAPVVVMSRVLGSPLGATPLSPAQTAALGVALRRLWSVPGEGLAERRYGPSTLPGTLRTWLSDNYDLGPCQDRALVGDAVAAALAWLAADRLPEVRLTALGIADLNPANVLWDGAVCRLVDFEDGGLTDPAYELADHTEHLAGRGVYDAEALVDAVGLSDTDRDRLASYRLLWACFWLAMLLPGNGGFHRNPPGTTESQAVRLLGLLR